MSIGSAFFCFHFLSKTRWKLPLFATTRPIIDINGVAMTVVVGVIIDKLVFVFTSKGRYIKSYNTLLVSRMKEVDLVYFHFSFNLYFLFNLFL